MPQRYKLTVAYDGTHYAGWQVQPNGTAVQALIEAALAEMNDDIVKLHGSGRTDAGVHARGQVAHCDLQKPFRIVGLQRALNAMLPGDIRINRVELVDDNFHARKTAIGKEYRYSIYNGPVLPPDRRLYRLQVIRPLDIEAMRAAAALLVGRHDFASFTANARREVLSTVRTIYRLEIIKRGREVQIQAEGEGFLYKMVRSLAGWLIRVGEGRVNVADTARILAHRERTGAVKTAPSRGLTLWRVDYPPTQRSK